VGWEDRGVVVVVFQLVFSNYSTPRLHLDGEL